jgi:hypothetical protein
VEGRKLQYFAEVGWRRRNPFAPDLRKFRPFFSAPGFEAESRKCGIEVQEGKYRAYIYILTQPQTLSRVQAGEQLGWVIFFSLTHPK